MATQRPRVLATILALLAAPLLACSGNQVSGGGSGGAPGSGGQTGATGGTTSSGGTTSTGGTTSSGGTTSTGGSTSTGGTTSSGGTTSAGGSTSTGGTTSQGGSGGATATGGTTSTGGATGRGWTTSAGSSTSAGGAAGSGGTTAAGGSTTSSGGVSGDGGTSTTGGASGAGGGTASVDCTDVSTTTKSFTKQYEDGSLEVTGSTKTYWTMTNWWHKFSGQTVTLNGLSMKLGNSQGASVPASDGNPMGFPSIFIGTYQNKATVDSNLPKQVSDIKSVPTIFQTNASSLDTSNLNATYDVWFTANSTPLSSLMANNPGKGGAYLMVWLFKPSARQPRGGSGAATGTVPNYPATTVNGVAGKWDVWVDKASDPLCISYVASDALDGLAYDLNNFIQDAVTKQYGITTSMYLSIIFAGFEVWSGGDGLECKQFCAAVN
jgi:hypothetical protein